MVDGAAEQRQGKVFAESLQVGHFCGGRGLLHRRPANGLDECTTSRCQRLMLPRPPIAEIVIGTEGDDVVAVSLTAALCHHRVCAYFYPQPDFGQCHGTCTAIDRWPQRCTCIGLRVSQMQ